MRWTGHLVGIGAARLALRAEEAKHQGHRKGKTTAEIEGHGKILGEDERWREGRPIGNYGKKELTRWFDLILTSLRQGSRE